MLKGIDLAQRIDFSSSFDIEEPKTIFVLRPLSGVEVLSMAKFVSGTEISSDYLLELLKASVEEIKNPDIKEKHKVIEFLSSLKPNVLMELVNETSSINKLSAVEEKN